MIDLMCEGGCGTVLGTASKPVDGMRCQPCYQKWEAELVIPPSYEELAAKVEALAAAVESAGIVVELSQ